ncbi:putative pentatricopeptide repeat-containing protein [Drosera capensis]
MLSSGDSPSAFTFPFLLKSTAALSLLVIGQQLHGHLIHIGCDGDTFVNTSLISLYCKCGDVRDARKVFDEMSERGREMMTKPKVCYNAMISGYMMWGRAEEGVELFREMRRTGVAFDGVTMLGLGSVCGSPRELRFGMCLHGCNVRFGLMNGVAVGNCLLSMYARCGKVEFGRRLFDEMSIKGLITWNAVINGYAQNGMAADVLNLYQEMKASGICPDAVTFLGVLSSCAYLGARAVGCEVELQMGILGLNSNPFLSNALINMHARCGNLVKARAIFDGLQDKSLVSWTAIIGGYGMHGQGEIAVSLFDGMINSGIHPDVTAFVSVLTACSHAGLPEKGLDYFYSMERDYGLHPEREHYSCMVDLLGRAGRLEEARNLITSMPFKPDAAVWGALLGACKIHKNVELAELAFERATGIEPTNIGYYVLLSNIYLDAGDKKGILKVRWMMRDRKLKKDPGYSYVDLKGKIHLFMSGDRSHPQTDRIYIRLKELEDSVKELGFTKNGDASVSVGVHSERLAIAFAVLNSIDGTEIVVIKNLRLSDVLFIVKLNKCCWSLKQQHHRHASTSSFNCVMHLPSLRLKSFRKKLTKKTLVDSETLLDMNQSLRKAGKPGFLAVYVGEKKERFSVPTSFLCHPLFKMLLEKTFDEYSFQRANRRLLLPCCADTFREMIWLCDRQL